MYSDTLDFAPVERHQLLSTTAVGSFGRTFIYLGLIKSLLFPVVRGLEVRTENQYCS